MADPLTVATPTDAGTAFTPVAATSGGDSFLNSGREFFFIVNGSADPVVVTFDSPGTCNFELKANAAHDLVVHVLAGAEKIIGPFSQTRFNDASGYVHVTYDAVTSDVKVGLLAAASNA
jgi:hypothetical protein